MSAIIKQYIQAMPYIFAKPDIESDMYNNAILIRKCVSKLDAQGSLSKIEKDILSAVFYGFNYSEIARLLGITRHTASLIFERVTDRIEYVLGGDLSDAALYDILDEHISHDDTF